MRQEAHLTKYSLGGLHWTRMFRVKREALISRQAGLFFFLDLAKFASVFSSWSVMSSAFKPACMNQMHAGLH